MPGAPSKARPILFVIAGPNGAGKSTYYDLELAPRLLDVPFVNPDLLIRDELGRPAESQAEMERGQVLADRLRADLQARRRSFVTESVFSHRSKLDLLRAARSEGYDLFVIHVGVADADLSVRRVEARVSEHGHPVPEDRIRARFARNGPLIREAVVMADRALVIDNSALNEPHRLMLRFAGGEVVWCKARPVAWVAALYASEIRRYRGRR